MASNTSLLNLLVFILYYIHDHIRNIIVSDIFIHRCCHHHHPPHTHPPRHHHET